MPSESHGRVAPLAAERLRSHVRAVGFNQQAVERNLCGSFYRPTGIFEGDDTGEADVHPQPQHLLRDLCRAGKAVHDALGTVFVEQFQCVLVGIPIVDDDRHVQILGKGELLFKDFALDIPRRGIVVVVIQSDFS